MNRVPTVRLSCRKHSPRSRASSRVLRHSCRITSPSRVATIERTPQDSGAAVEAWAHEWQELMTTQGVTLQLDRITELGQAVFHASTLRCVVLNVVHNALDAMPQGGTFTLAGERAAIHVHLHVRDTESGIPAEQLPHIFEPLSTTKPEGTTE